MAFDNTCRATEDAIRLRSYMIWEREGCPEGKALEHWLRAREELAADANVSLTLQKSLERKEVVPLVPISTRPCKSIAARVTVEKFHAKLNVAKQ